MFLTPSLFSVVFELATGLSSFVSVQFKPIQIIINRDFSPLAYCSFLRV